MASALGDAAGDRHQVVKLIAIVWEVHRTRQARGRVEIALVSSLPQRTNVTLSAWVVFKPRPQTAPGNSR